MRSTGGKKQVSLDGTIAGLAHCEIRVTHRYACERNMKRCYDQPMPHIERIQSTGWVNTRRSQRVVLSLPVVVRAQFEGENPCAEKSHTLVVNAHGALIALALRVRPEQPLMLENRGSGKEQRCRVVHVGERQCDKAEVGVEFAEPAPHFWNIEFPPADWKPPLD